MKPTYWAVLAVVILAGGFFFLTQSMNNDAMLSTTPGADTQMTVPETNMMPTEPTDTAMMSVIPLSEQNDLGQSGTATIRPNDAGMAVVTLSMTGGEFPDPQPAHIHVGSCPEPGAVEYPLTNVVDGMSQTTLTVSYEELITTTEPMAINVHKSAAEASMYTACGDLN